MARRRHSIIRTWAMLFGTVLVIIAISTVITHLVTFLILGLIPVAAYVGMRVERYRNPGRLGAHYGIRVRSFMRRHFW